MLKYSVLEQVEKSLILKAKNNDRCNKVFHPSEWSGCHRKIAYAYYESMGAIQIDESAWKISPQLERIFGNGHYMHSRWRNYVEGLGILSGRWKCLNKWSHTEPKIYGEDNSLGILRPRKCECGSDQFEYIEIGFRDKETNWGGHIDAILNLEHVGSSLSYILLDFKTINPYEFKKLSKPKDSHLVQVQIYMYLSGIQLAKVLYEDKATQGVKEFDVERDDQFLEEEIESAKLLKYRLNNRNSNDQRVLPPRKFMSSGHKDCLRCKYRGHCWKK